MNNYCVDINREYSRAKAKMLRSSLLFSLFLTGVIVGDIILVLFAGEDYLVNLIIASVITVLFIWFAIYFFTNIYNDIDKEYRYYRGYEGGLKAVEEVEFLKKSDELCYINGLYVYPLYVRYAIGLSRLDKVIFTLSPNLDYEMGDKLTITTYQRILIEAEKHS